MRRIGSDFLEKFSRHGAHLKPEQILDLSRKDDDRNACREAGDHRLGDVLDPRPEAGEARDDQHQAGEGGREEQTVEAVARDHIEHDDDEGARRTADLKTAAAEPGNQKPRNHRGHEALFGRAAGRDAERHRERKRNDRYGQARDRVLPKVFEPVPQAQHREQFWDEQVPLLRFAGHRVRLGRVVARR